jgi:WD40 repeat protein
MLWDLPGRKRLAIVPEADAVTEIVLSRDGRRLAFPDRNERQFIIRVWDTQAARFIGQLTAPGVTRIPYPWDIPSFSPDGRFLAVTGGRGGVPVLCIWDTESGEQMAMLREATSPRWGNDRTLITTGPARPGEKEMVAPSAIAHEIIHGGGVKMLLSIKKSHLALWEVTPAAPKCLLDSRVESLSFNGDGSRLVTNQYVWGVTRTGHRFAVQHLPVPGEGVFPVFRGQDELWWTDLPAWRSDRDTNVTIGRLEPSRLKSVLPNPGYPEFVKREIELMKAGGAARDLTDSIRAVPHPYRLEFGPDGKTFLLASEIYYEHAGFDFGRCLGEKCLELWDTTTPKRLTILDASGNWQDFRFTPDGRRIITAGEGGLLVWDVSRGKVERTLLKKRCGPITLSRDGKAVLAVESDGPTHLFEVETGTELRSWPADKVIWQVVALGPTLGHIIASGGSDGTIRLWDSESGRELARWRAHESRVTALAFSPDGDTLVSGGDGTVMFWDLPYIRKELASLGLDWEKK